jgi:hypothetical protein
LKVRFSSGISSITGGSDCILFNFMTVLTLRHRLSNTDADLQPMLVDSPMKGYHAIICMSRLRLNILTPRSRRYIGSVSGYLLTIILASANALVWAMVSGRFQRLQDVMLSTSAIRGLCDWTLSFGSTLHVRRYVRAYSPQAEDFLLRSSRSAAPVCRTQNFH